MINKYIKKPVEVEAVCWDGTNKSEVEQFLGRKLLLHSAKQALVSPSFGGEVIRLGDFLVKTARGSTFVCESESFDNLYEAVRSDSNE